ncbi:MAG: CpsD/CapB family tyrosine-protein kinase [Planctomycetota bacterium JB042]
MTVEEMDAASPDRPTSEPPVIVITDRSIDPHVVVYHEPKSIQSEQYRAFRTNMLAMEKGRGSRALAITSSMKGEGKSLSAVNIAICLAEAPRLRVCLLDTDFRAPSVGRLLGLGDGPGLSDLLLDDLELGDVLCETKVRDLCVIRAGREPRNPAELLASDRVGDLLSALKTEFTHIICDTPPINPYTDAAVLGARMDGVLLVVRMGKTSREQAERAKHVLQRAGNNVIGSFLTDVAAAADEIDYYKRLEE